MAGGVVDCIVTNLGLSTMFSSAILVSRAWRDAVLTEAAGRPTVFVLDGNPQDQTTFFRFNLVRGSWETITVDSGWSLGSPIESIAACGGSIYLAGAIHTGIYNGGSLETVMEVYCPSTGSWTKLHTARKRPGTHVCKGVWYDDVHYAESEAEAADVGDDHDGFFGKDYGNFGMHDSMIPCRSIHCGIGSVCGKISLIAGYNIQNANCDDWGHSGAVTYDPALAKWSPSGNSMEQNEVWYPEVTSGGSSLFVVGGKPHNYDWKDSDFNGKVHSFDVRTQSFTKLADLKVARRQAAVAVVGSKLYVVGGLRAWTPEDGNAFENGDGEPCGEGSLLLERSIETIDVGHATGGEEISRQSASLQHTLELPIGGCDSCAAITMDQHLWVIGGESSRGALDTVWSFDVGQNIWFEMPPLPKAVGLCLACVC